MSKPLTHCKRGLHELTPQNSMWRTDRDGFERRRCRACWLEYKRTSPIQQEWHQQYRQRPLVKERQRQYAQLPRRKEQQRQYKQDPIQRERHRQYMRRWRARKAQLQKAGADVVR